MVEFVQALKAGQMIEFKGRLRSFDLLLVDDIQFIIGKASAQEELLYTIDALLAEGKRLAGDDDHSLVRPEDMAREAMQMRKYFRSLNPEYQRLALELVKTLVKAQGKAT